MKSTGEFVDGSEVRRLLQNDRAGQTGEKCDIFGGFKGGLRLRGLRLKGFWSFVFLNVFL